ncbi:substrate-binding periplasmic protein [Agarivorans sp. DSG3-1]|uniref:substrate-binding periplasmic protein n=1 Tax=Agarivorans sp. DSG3-1 TaxID=3342249 RepID=UPI00398E5A78
MKMIVLVMLMLISVKLHAGPSLRISTVETIAALPNVSELVSNAYAELGYQVEIIPMPAKRSLYQAKNNFGIDAELARTEYVASYLPHHLMIPVPLAYINIAAFVKREEIDISQWEDLQGYQVAGVRGHLFLEVKLENHASTVFFSDAHQALTMLGRGRVDVVILPQSIGEYVVKKYWHKQIKMLSPSLDAIPVYHYLHDKHRGIADSLAAVLRKLTAEPLVKN